MPGNAATWNVQALRIFAALRELLHSDRLFGDPKEWLAAILENSRKYQIAVSTQLAGQVIEALYELLRGSQAAQDRSKIESYASPSWNR